MLQQVRSYKTSDGKLFDNRAEALVHNAMLDIRGIVQGNGLGKISQMTPTDVAQFVIKYGTEIKDIITKMNDSIRRMKR